MAMKMAVVGKTSIKATVKKIIYQNLQNNYCVISFKIDNAPDFTAVGQFLSCRPGQCFVLHGEWTKNIKYREAWQFAVERVENAMPEGNEAIIEYLSSGLFPGIGPSIAREIVRKFQGETLKILADHPTRLTEIKGITPAKVIKIVKAHETTKHMEELILKLGAYAIPNTKIHKMFQKFGEKTLDFIIKNPFFLFFEGISFRIADIIARDCKKPANDENRISACILHVLSEYGTRDGHTYLPFGVLVQKVKDTLQEGEISGEIDRNEISRILNEAHHNKTLVIENWLVYLPEYYIAEKESAEKLREIISRPQKTIVNTEKIIADMEKKSGIRYAEKQKEAFLGIKNGCFIITGGPGTGKTTIIKGIIEIYKRNFPASVIKLAAPTGRAAKRLEEATKMEAKTLHRLLEYRGEDGNIICARNEHNPLSCDLIIIDETSMMDLVLTHNLLKAIRPSTSIIFVGDADQLPSVGAGNVLKDMIQSGKVPAIELNEIFRQEGTSKIIINAAKINCGDIDMEYDKDFVIIEKAGNLAEAILDVFKKELAEIKNIHEVQVITPLRKKTESGADSLNEVIQGAINPKEKGKGEIHHGKRVFRKYDKVMQFKNNYEKEVFNGDTGIIEMLDAENGKLSVSIDDVAVEYTKEDIDELYLAYAMSVHKSQGCEYETVIVPLSMQHKRMLQRNLLYTAITRAKKRVILVGDLKALAYGITNNKTVDRFSQLKNKIRGK